jgi:hypothetical protein
MAEKKLAKNKLFSKEETLKEEKKEIYEQESAEIKQDEQFLAKLKVLFFREAEVIADNSLSWEKKCKECLKLVEEQNTILRKVKSDTSMLFKLTEKSEKVIDEEETELFLKRHTSQEGAAIAGITTELNKAKNMSALLEKMNFLVLYDLDMLLQDQILRKQLYAKSVKELSADTSKQDFIKNQYSRLIKACRYLNEILKYVLGEENLSKYEIFVEEKMQKSFKT